MKISTCRYMRFKMKIDSDSPMCSLCRQAVESLIHIFITCHVTNVFIKKVNTFIVNKIDPNYSDPNKFYFITCSHDNILINFLNIIAKWYISRQFQCKNHLIWEGYAKYVKIFICGEKHSIAHNLKDLF